MEKDQPLLNKQQSLPIQPRKYSDDDDEEDMIEFIDPQMVKKAQLEQEKSLKKKEVPMIKLKDGSLVPASSLMNIGGGGSHSAAQGAAASDKNRKLFIQNLQNQQRQKRSQNLTLDKVKETFQKTELTDATEGKNFFKSGFKTSTTQQPIEEKQESA